jgi:hypothetical protein
VGGVDLVGILHPSKKGDSDVITRCRDALAGTRPTRRQTITLPDRHHTSLAMHLVFLLLYHVLATHMHRVGQKLLGYRTTFDICAQTRLTLLELLRLLASTGIIAVGLDAHDIRGAVQDMRWILHHTLSSSPAYQDSEIA